GAEIATEVTRDLDAGEVLLLHDADHYSEPGCWRGTVAALPMVVERIRSAGLRPVTPQETGSVGASWSSRQRVAAVATTSAIASPIAVRTIVPRCGMPRLKMFRVQGRVSSTTKPAI